MSNLKEIISRVKTVSSIIKMTNAMKMVSSVKLKKFKNKIINLKLYKKKIEKFYFILINKKKIKIKKNKKNILLIIITSNRGLCGSFNNFLLKTIEKLIKKKYFKENIYLFPIGKIGKKYLEKKYQIFLYNNKLIDNLNEENLSTIVNIFYKKFLKGFFSEIKIIYNNYKLISIKKILPFKKKKIYNLNYIFEPYKKKILKFLIPKILKIKIYNSILESITSEHLSRMIAMHKAKDNGIKIKNELLFFYNKLRKEKITKEILEIVGGI
ncbi:F0F1 ATP synthase subunit gamma [Candidatus Karelsulcia muelleri]|uniref:ATP synthase F1 subunit gamma n=1 Tax=Candidatus Karelsulcia muelleri PSPU TaxID=1189303 RepID=A0AAD1AZ50_9FLAO|nr:FoF1 ATP synthase subunit gamma [Candidatus Karelsulcia muelleri]NJJ98816.1 F0F1 ATP synthase subunit gamma [Candidatus Karelsulcia muelleri]BAO66216.1 ATP synthase F1 subunit gamma [Candidatus Karelsulcia muelleri PSPU]